MSIVPGVAAFALLALAAWGVGDTVLGRLLGQRLRSLGVTSYALAILCGFGILGQIGFVLGLIPGSYRIGPIAIVMVALGVFSLARLHAVHRELRLLPVDRLGFGEIFWMVPAVAIWYLGQWLGVLGGFPDGSDVFSHHYSHAKAMLQLHRFGFSICFPYGTDNLSNYNPTLAHVLYVVARATGGDRAANLFHWLTCALLLFLLYGAARLLRSRQAGAMAVAIYLGMGVVNTYALDVSDYVLFAAFLLASITLVLLAARESNRGLLLAAALNAGFVLSTKYYALVLVPLLVLLVCFAERGTWLRRVKSAAIFAGVAAAVYAPWPIYFTFRFHDPIYPFLRRGPWFENNDALAPIYLLSRFMNASDTSLAGPWFRYLLAYVLPIQSSFNVWTLTPLFIPGLVLVCGYLLVGPARNEGLLLGAWAAVALLSMGFFFASSSVKWTFFPACALCVSLAVCVDDWRRPARLCAWLVVLVVVALSYVGLGAGQLQSSKSGTRLMEEERWTPLARRLNASVERQAVIAGVDYFTKFYLRDDIRTIEAQESLCDDWPREEQLMRRAGAGYYIVDSADRPSTEQIYQSTAARWAQIGQGEGAKARYLRRFLQRYRARTDARDRYLHRHARLVGFIGTVQIYRLRQ